MPSFDIAKMLCFIRLYIFDLLGIERIFTIKLTDVAKKQTNMFHNYQLVHSHLLKQEERLQEEHEEGLPFLEFAVCVCGKLHYGIASNPPVTFATGKDAIHKFGALSSAPS